MVASRVEAQRMAALREANRIRRARADLKHELKTTGAAGASGVVSAPHPDFLSMRVHELLCAVPRVGPLRARRIMLRCEIGQHRTLAEITARQRALLAGELEARS